MRVLIMILILMDYVKKDTTVAVSCWSLPHCNTTLAVSCRQHPHCNTSLAVSCWFLPHCSECVLYKCQNDVICYSCECQTGYQGQHCTETTTTMMSTSSERILTASSMEPATAPTQYSSSTTTNVAETTFNSLTNGSTRVSTSPTISSPTTEVEPSTRSEKATSSPFLDAQKKSAQVSVIAGSIGGIVFIVLLTIGLVILFRERTRRHVSDDTETTYTKYNNDIDSNPAYDALGAPSADNVPPSSKDSGFSKHDNSMEAEMMDGEYNTLRLHFPVTNGTQDNTYNHIGGSLTTNSTYSHIPNSKDALCDNTYSHMSNITHGRSLEPKDKDATFNHVGDSCSSKRKGKIEESRDETYNHARINHVRPAADQEDQDDNYSHINLSGLKAQVPNADEHRVDAQEPTRTHAEYAKAKM